MASESDASDASAIDFIQNLIQKGFAYELDGYIVFDWTTFASASASASKYPAPAPVQYPVLRGRMRSPLDFIPAVGAVHGRMSFALGKR